MKFAVILALAAVAQAGDEAKKEEVKKDEKKDDKKKEEVKKDDKKKDDKKVAAKKIALNGKCNSKKEKMGCDKDLRCAGGAAADDKTKAAFKKYTKAQKEQETCQKATNCGKTTDLLTYKVTWTCEATYLASAAAAIAVSYAM